jgi:hypothetical protein
MGLSKKSFHVIVREPFDFSQGRLRDRSDPLDFMEIAALRFAGLAMTVLLLEDFL